MVSSKSNLQVLYEDNHIIAINKRPGDIVQGDKTGDTPLSEIVKEYIKKKYNKPGEVFLGTVHRLDRPTSGIVLFARTSKALERLNKMFHDREVKKTYLAVVRTVPQHQSATLVHFLKKNQQRNKSYSLPEETEGVKRAELRYHIAGSSDHYRLLEIKPTTGRHHQIRVQLAEIGCPIKGDVKYGFTRTNKDASIHLHARKLELRHPVQKETLVIEAPVPDEVLWKAFNT